MVEYKLNYKNQQLTSSKGNQIKFKAGDVWYKFDYLGYEGASEYVVSELLKHSNVSYFVRYDLEDIRYKDRNFVGCKSNNFLHEQYNIVTLDKLIQNYTGKSCKTFFKDKSVKEQISSLVDFVKSVTNLEHFGEYLTTMLELDGLILNEDRHLQNIAVLTKGNGTYEYCPIFDNGAAFLSDMDMDYPLEKPIGSCLRSVKSKPFSTDFDKQVKAAEELYGIQLQISPDFSITEEMKSKLDERYEKVIANRISIVSNIAMKKNEKFLSNEKKQPIWEEDIKYPISLKTESEIIIENDYVRE